MHSIPPAEALPGASEAIGRPPARGFLLVDDHMLIRDGMRMAIEQIDPLVRLREAGTCAEALQVLEQAGPGIEVVLLDLDLPDSRGLDTLQRIRRACSTQRIAVFTGQADGQLALSCIHHGAVCFITKQADMKDFQIGLQAVLSGRLYLPPTLLAAAAAAAAREEPPPIVPVQAHPHARPSLSPRQQEVLGLLLNGCTNQAIAHALGISPDTAKMHVSAILRAHHVATRTQLVLRYAAAPAGESFGTA